MPRVGEVYAVRFSKNNNSQKPSFYQVQSMFISNQSPSKEILKPIEGILTINDNNSFGFLQGAFVPPPIVQKYSLRNGQKLIAKAIMSYNNKHKNWGWKIISIEK
jgi:hypothetical protein